MIRTDAKLTSKGQLVVPKAVRNRLRLAAGDRVRFVETRDGIMIEKLVLSEADDPFAVFAEWAGEADDKAYRDL